MKWINFKENQPELNTLLVINCIDNEKVVCVYVKDIDGQCEFFTGGFIYKKENVTHWIELPEFNN